MSFFVAKNIIKNYANHRALDDVSIEIPEGAIYGSVSYTHLTLPTIA